jgi:hypothetical protein
MWDRIDSRRLDSFAGFLDTAWGPAPSLLSWLTIATLSAPGASISLHSAVVPLNRLCYDSGAVNFL